MLPPSVAAVLEYPGWSRAVAVEGWCARNAYQPLHVDWVADHFRVDRKTIYRDARQVGWHDVLHLIAAARLLHVAALIMESVPTVDRVASRLRFPSTAVLYHLVKRATGKTPSELRDAGAMLVTMAFWRARGRLG